MKKQILAILTTFIIFSAAIHIWSEENTVDEKIASLKKKLENIDKQFADKERLQKEAENDPCLAAALQRREKAIEKMKTHINDMIAAIQTGDEAKINELRNAEKELGKELELSNRAIFYAKQAAMQRRSMEEIKNKLSNQKEKALPEDEEMQKTLSSLIATYEELATNPPEGYEENEKIAAARKRLDELELLRSKKIVEQEFASATEKIKKQIEENQGNPEIKEAGEKLLQIYSQIKELKITAIEARAKERSMVEEKYVAESKFQEKLKNIKKAAEEAKQKEKAE